MSYVIDGVRITRKRADAVRVGDVVDGLRVESVENYGPMLGEAYGYARHVEIVCAPNGIFPGTVQYLRGDLSVRIWEAA